MRTISTRRHAPGARRSQGLAAFSAVLLLISAISHRFGFLDTVPFIWLLGLSGILAFLSLCLALMGFVQIWERGSQGLKAAIFGALLSAAVLAPFAVSVYWLVIHPPLTDISSDISRRPQFARAGALRHPPMNPLRPVSQDDALLQERAYPHLASRRYEYPKETVLEAVLTLTEARGWKLLGPVPLPAQPAAPTTIEAVAPTFLLGFPSDVAIRVEGRGGATFVDMRSASRYGRHDLGDNARRIDRFFQDLDLRIEQLGEL